MIHLTHAQVVAASKAAANLGPIPPPPRPTTRLVELHANPIQDHCRCTPECRVAWHNDGLGNYRVVR